MPLVSGFSSSLPMTLIPKAVNKFVDESKKISSDKFRSVDFRKKNTSGCADDGGPSILGIDQTQ